jgi:glycosyltransferase involved in cell wall biosynthesis
MKILNIMLSRDLGGVQQSFLDYSKMLKIEKIDVINVSSIGAAINNAIKADYKLPNLGIWDLLSSMKLKSIIKKEKPDAIIVHGRRATKFALQARQRTNIPLIGVIHSDKLKWVDKCEHIIVLTNIMKNTAINNGIEPSRLYLIPNAIDSSICKISHKKDEESPPPIIGTMGRFVPKKGIDVFLKSLAILIKTGIGL